MDAVVTITTITNIITTAIVKKTLVDVIITTAIVKKTLVNVIITTAIVEKTLVNVIITTNITTAIAKKTANAKTKKESAIVEMNANVMMTITADAKLTNNHLKKIKRSLKLTSFF